jgi:precorrin-6B methylase 2
LRGGRAGAERLHLLNRVKWPTTQPLLRAAGLRAGMSCLDVGCGSGDVTLKMAALVGAEGNVVGVDRDQTILRFATMEHIREAVVGAGLVSGREVENLVAELGRLAEDDRTLMSIAPTFQVWGRRVGA